MRQLVPCFFLEHVLEPLGIKGHNSKLNDESLASGDRFLQQMSDAGDYVSRLTAVGMQFDQVIEGLDEKVEDNYGAWGLPDGEEYRKLALKLFTTTDYTPEYIREVGRLQAELFQTVRLVVDTGIHAMRWTR